jgi:hypothetical protein
MNLLGIVVGTTALVAGFYLFVGWSQQGFPHYCFKHGLQFSGICFGCEIDEDRGN